MRNSSIAQFYADDHDRLDELFKQFQASKKTSLSAARTYFHQFTMGLRQHIAWEEDILFPLFEERTGMRGTGPTEVMRLEHQQIKELLRAIKQHIQQSKPSSDSEEAALWQLLTDHNHKEERVLYPLIDQQLTADERQEVFTRMKQADHSENCTCYLPSKQA